MKKIALVFLAIALSSCAGIKHYENFSKETGSLQTASIGSELYRIHKQRDLPNVFGKADLWGGKIDEGFTELRFMGITEDGKVIFRLTDIDIQSNETVFTRYGVSRSTIHSNTNANASAYGNTAYGTSSTNATITRHEKPEARITKLPPSTVEFVFDPTVKILKLEGVSVEIIETTQYSLSYILHRLDDI